MIILWLKRILKYTFLLLLIILLAIVSWVGYYYFKEIRPYKPIIENILANADPENRHPPKNVVAMVESEFYCSANRVTDLLLGEGKCGASKEQLIAQNILGRRNAMRTFHRHLHEMGLAWMISKSYSTKDKHALFSELTYTGYGKYGFNSFATQHFGKPLSELTIDESATLVSVLKAPSYYLQQPEKSAKRKNLVLERYNANSH